MAVSAAMRQGEIMKKCFCLLFHTVLLLGSLFAQTRTAHYELIAEAGAERGLPSLAREMELRFEVYNNIFRFDPSALGSPLKVRVFTDPAAYGAYVSARLGSAPAGAVYLHYSNTENRELIILRGSAEEAFMVAHQAFIQFLRGFIPNPPTWIREGFAIYFNTLTFDPLAQTLNFEENLAWLDTVKGLGQRAPSPRELIMADTVQSRDASSPGSAGMFSREFQICSWALVSFFLNSDEYFRDLTDCFMVLSPEATTRQNSLAVMDRFSLWIDFHTLDNEYKSYIASRRTFAELMDNGRNAYIAGDITSAEFSFLAAQDLRPTHYGPYYYLGLIYYQERLHGMAEENYLLSLEHGADEALVFFALGVNAVSAGRINDARAWLERAAAADPARYRASAADILQRL